VSRQDIPVVLEEQAQIVGGPVKVADYAFPGSIELAESALKILGKDGSAVLLANHGLVGIGEDLTTALQICRIIERSARIILWSKPLGSPYILSPGDVTELRNNYLQTYGQGDPAANS
jgi:L-fuculose-phosphate aldolase